MPRLCAHCCCMAFAIWAATVVHVEAEDVDTAWVRLYDGPAAKADNAFDVDVDDSGYVYVTGSAQAQSGMFQPIHVLTMKFTPDGDTTWVRLFLSAGGSVEQGKHIQHTSDGHIIVAAINAATELMLIKYSPDGDTIWTRHYSLLLNPVGMEVNASGDIWVIGTSGTADWRTVHYHADGAFQWVATFADIGGGSDITSGLAVDTADNAYVTGVGTGIGGNVDIVTIKYGPDGAQIWRRRYDGLSQLADAGARVSLASNDTIYVVGASEVSGGDNDLVVIRYESDGDSVWTRRFDAPGDGPDVAVDADVDATGNLYVSGTIYISGSTSKNGTVKFNSSGDTVWARYWGPSLTVRDIVAEPDGDLYLTGEGNPPGSLFSDWGILKYSPSGDSAWFRWLYNGLFPVGFQTPRALAVATDGSLLACGTTSSGPGGSNNVGVAKFLSIPTCACDCHGDPACDGVQCDILDVVATVNEAFRGAPVVPDPNPSCPYVRTDVDCSGAPTVIDVVRVVNVAFRGANVATEFCNPCP